MIDSVQNSLGFQAEALKLRAARQQVLASNIANAETPGYKAQDFNFARALEQATSPRVAPAAASAPRPVTESLRIEARPGVASPDGNTVNMDTERTQFVDNALRYEAALRFLNGKIRTLMSAIQG